MIGDDLYTYHDPSWNQANSKPERAIARTSLKTGEGKVWNLPDYFWAGDMIVADGKILLAETDGVFEFDPETGTVTRRVKIDHARLMATKELHSTVEQLFARFMDGALWVGYTGSGRIAPDILMGSYITGPK